MFILFIVIFIVGGLLFGMLFLLNLQERDDCIVSFKEITTFILYYYKLTFSGTEVII